MDPARLSGTFSSVYENFKQEEEFGWFLPAPEDFSSAHYFFQIDDGDEKYKQAAVMFLLAEINESLHVLLTKRSTSVRTHKGKLSGSCRPSKHKNVYFCRPGVLAWWYKGAH